MAQRKVHGLGDNVPFQLIVSPDTAEVDIYMPSAGVMGRLAGSGAHQVIPFADLPGGGGAASIIDITYADMETAIAGATLIEGQFYRITDASGTDLGFVCQAVKTDEITVNGTGGYLNADFQAVGDYANTPETFNAQLGIWRTGFEEITIPYTNLTGGTFAVGETITGGTSGATAVIVTDDGSTSMTAYMTSAGVAFDGSEVLDNGAGVTADQDGAASSPTIVLGDVVIWNLLHWQLTDPSVLNGNNPEANTAAYTLLDKATYPETYVTAWDVSEFDFPGNSIQYRKDLLDNVVSGVSSVQGFPFGNGNVNNNFVLGGGVQPNGYGDINRNIVYQGAGISTSGWVSVSECILFANSTIAITGPEDSSVVGCTLYPSAVITEITIGVETRLENNILENGAQMTGITAGNNCLISSNKIGPTAILGGGTILGDSCWVTDNVFLANASFDFVSGNEVLIQRNQFGHENFGITFGNNAAFRYNTFYQLAAITNCTILASTVVDNNIVENGGFITGITAGANCSISRNKIGQGATLGGSTTMGDGAQMDDNVVGASSVFMQDSSITGSGNANKNTLGLECYLRNMAISSGAVSYNAIGNGGGFNNVDVSTFSLSNNELYLGSAVEDSTLIADPVDSDFDGFNSNVLKYSIFNKSLHTLRKSHTGTDSNYDEAIDISGLTTLDCLAENNYVGIFNLTSTNATEAIDTITNFPTLFPFTLRPAAGLVLTVTGTPIATPIAAGQIALTTADIVLDGDKGEYLELVCDATQTYLVEKSRLTGIV